MANPVPNRRPPVFINQERVNAFLAAVEYKHISSWLQETARYIQAWRRALNAKPRASLRSPELPWRVQAILGGQKALRPKLAVLRAFLRLLVAREDLRPDEDHLSDLETSFFQGVDLSAVQRLMKITGP